MSIAESRFSQPALEFSPKFLKVALVLKASRHLTAALAIGIMHHHLVIANCIGVQRTDREVVVRRRARSHVQRRDRRRPPVQLNDVLANAQVARRDPAAIRRQPRMITRGVDRLVGRGIGRGRMATVRRGRRLTVGDVAVRNLVTAWPNESLYAAVRRMSRLGLRQLPVVDADLPSPPVGMVRRSNVLAVYEHATDGSSPQLPIPLKNLKR